MAEVVGRTLGQYTVLKLIGSGGMAQVYQGFQPALEREVAIKVISARDEHDGQQARASFLRQFETEARMVAKLAHPYIVPIHDFGVDSDWAYLVMELITHGSVREEIKNARAAGRPLDLLWTLMILDQVATALDFAHHRGVAHRDVKPGNMLLREPTMVVLSDFGVAKMLADREAMTGNAPVMGTPQYMAPEQARPNGSVDGRCDIYSLGVVLFECATGRLPFLGDTGEAIMLQHLSTPPPSPRSFNPQIPPVVERIILRAMAKDPNARFPRAADMAQELRMAHAELAQTLALNGRQPSANRAGPTAPVHANPQPGVHYPTPRTPHGTTEPGTCFRCGALNEQGSRYCIVCGYDMGASLASSDTYRALNGRPLRCRLIFYNGPFAGSAFTLHQGVTTIGRAVGNDLLLQDGSVSRMHARLSFAHGVWYIEDVGSSNGIWVHNKQVKRPLALSHGDIVRLGNVEAIFEVIA